MKIKKEFIFILFFLIILFFYFNQKKPNKIIKKKLEKNLYCFWTGKNSLTENRKKNLETLKNTGFNIVFVTHDNLNNYILKDYPLHDGYQYLSETHKSDYLRCYFMNFYGGGYTDIKRINKDNNWSELYDKLLKSDDLLAVGYAERNIYDINYGDSQTLNYLMKQNYKKMIGNGCYIMKPQTELTTEWYDSMIQKMDNVYEDLKKNPAKKIRENHPTEGKKSNYPLEWGFFNKVSHKMFYKYRKRINTELTYVNMDNYQ